MANEVRLIPCGEKCTLDELPCGTLFAFGDDCIAVKSEYRCGNGLIEAFIINSGEQFWGGAKTAREQIALMVQPMEIKEVDAVEVVHGRWIEDDASARRGCSRCGFSIHDDASYELYGDYKVKPKYCPECGAMMDGGNEDATN